MTQEKIKNNIKISEVRIGNYVKVIINSGYNKVLYGYVGEFCLPYIYIFHKYKEYNTGHNEKIPDLINGEFSYQLKVYDEDILIPRWDGIYIMKSNKSDYIASLNAPSRLRVEKMLNSNSEERFKMQKNTAPVNLNDPVDNTVRMPNIFVTDEDSNMVQIIRPTL